MKIFHCSLVLLIGCLACHADPIKLKLKDIGSFKLEERGDSILAGIGSVRINPSGTLMLICDSKSKALFLYSRDGRLYNAFFAGADLNDSLVTNNKPFNPSDSLVHAVDLNKTFGVPLTQLLSNIRSEYRDACFINDTEIIAGAEVKAWLYHRFDSREEMPKWTTLEGSLVRLGINGKVHSFAQVQTGTKENFAWLNSLNYNRSTERVSCDVANPLAARAGHWDSTAGLAEIDLNGNYIQTLCNIPMQFMASHLGYGFLDYRLASSDAKTIFAVTNIPVVYSSAGNKLFDLEGVLERNEVFFRLASQKAVNSSIPWDSVLRSRDFGFSQLITKPDGGIVAIFTIRTKDAESRPQWKVQEYSESGSLLSEATLDQSNIDGNIEQVSYDVVRGIVIVFTSNTTNGWKVTEYKEVSE